MQKTICGCLLCLMGLGLFSSCENELHIAAEWKEIAIVYGLLNPTDTTNYIRVQRAYLDEKSSALSFSDIPDSLYFDTLQVSITEYLNGVEGNTYSLYRVNGNDVDLPKDDGIFNSDVNYLYRLNAEVKASSFFNSYAYKLTIYNPKSGYIVSSQTVSVGQAEVKYPPSANSQELIILADSNFKLLAMYKEGIHARSYDMWMRIEIEEIQMSDSNIRERLFLDWRMVNGKLTNSTAGFHDAVHTMNAYQFFDFIASKLDPDKDVRRRLIGYDLYTYGIAEDLYNYINVNKPSIGIVQKKPEYSNIENGYGIFSSRYINRGWGIKFESRTKLAMTQSPATQNLNFVTY